MNKSSACINVEFLGGENIEDAIKEAKRLSRLLQIAYVSFSFNGQKLVIGKTANIEHCLQLYKEQAGHIVSA